MDVTALANVGYFWIHINDTKNKNEKQMTC